MTDPQRQPVVTLLDACAVLSLYATRRMAEIVAVVSGPVAVADAVIQEALYVRRIVEGVQEREPVDLSPLVASGILSVIGTRDEDPPRLCPRDRRPQGRAPSRRSGSAPRDP
jgi:hypothetical protein